MLDYREGDQIRILRAMEDDIMALVVVDLATDDFEVVYTDGAYREFGMRYSSKRFFRAWEHTGLSLVWPDDRERMGVELGKPYMAARLENASYYTVTCKFAKDGEPVHCRIKVAAGVLGKDMVVISFRNIDAQVKGGVTRGDGLPSSAEVDKPPHSFTRPEGVCDRRDHAVRGPSDAPDRQDHAVRGPSDAPDRRDLAVREPSDAPDRRDLAVRKPSDAPDRRDLAVRETSDAPDRRDLAVRKLQDTVRALRAKTSAAQVEPHFMFNALSSIREVVLDDPERGADLLYDFTTHLRAYVRALEADGPVPFARELENVRAYVSIEQMRLGERLKVEYDIEVDDFPFIPFGVQPLVENAIRHGIYERGPAGGTVRLATREVEAGWQVRVADDGVGFDVTAMKAQVAQGKRDSVGLSNLTLRLRAVLGATLSVESTPGRGTVAIIDIPMLVGDRVDGVQPP